MRDNGSLPSYEQLFGALDFREGDDSRSVYSPAAYLADLLQLLEENFDTPSLMQRRPDLKEIPLDASHTYTEVPYLDIVNEVLEKVLENGEDTDAYSILSALRFPFVLPFSLGNERLKRYLHYAQVSPEQLYGAFSTQPDGATVARVYLGLSIADRDLITTTLTGAAGATALAECYHLTADESVAVLEDVDRFLRATGMTGLELQELLYQSLSTTALDPAGRPERTRASEFFIHQGGTCVTLDADEQKLIWGDGSAPVPFAWFERVNRFVRLARKVSLSFTDLDLVLRSCCASRLDLAALGTIAVVTRLCDVLQLPVDVVCSLLAPLDTLGIGDETAPQDLFDRTFNVPFADIEKTVIPGSAFRPAAYLSGVELLTSSGDLLAMRNRDYRSRVARALAISEPDLSYIVTRFREHYAGTTTAPSPFDRDTAGVEVLSLLHRVSRLAAALGISVTDLFGVLDALDRDPSIRSYTTFPVLIDTAGPTAQTQDCYHVLEAADGPASLWLVQTVAAVATWMQANDFTSQELNQILSGDPGSDPVAAVCAAVGQQFMPVLLVPGMFTSSRFSARASRVVHDAVMACDGLVSGRDRRLLIFDRERASAAAYAALTQLATVTAADFAGLGLADRLVAKIFANLVCRGYANADGTLVEGALPVAADGFCLAGDFTAVHDELFALIAGLCPAEADDAEEPGTDPGTGPPAGPLADQADGPAPITQAPITQALGTGSWDAPTLDVSAPDTPAQAADASAQDISALDVSAPDTPAPDASSWDALTANPPAPATGPDAGSAVPPADGPAAGGTAAPQNGGPPAAVSFFPSDLEALTGLPADQRAELYDNLVFNGYLSPDGTVPAPEFFTDPDNASAFTVNADLFGVGPAVLARIRQCYSRFDQTPLTLTTAVFAELELTDAQLADLLENLRFNGYLDRGHVYVDKGTLLGLPPGRLDLALEFYPYRRAVLDAVQQQITDFRSSCATVQPEDFRDIGEAAVTARVVERLTGPYLGEDGRLAADAAAFFGDPGNAGSAFGLDQSFLPNEQATAFQQMAAITAEWQSYALDPKVLADLHFDADESATLIGMLSAAGDLNQYLTIPRKRIAWFLRAASALAFNLPGIEDYERDIFSALHAVAKELSAGMTELVAALATLAGQQQAALGAAVADAFGLDAGTALALCEAIAGGAAEAPDMLVAPALAAATPAEDRFRRACRRIAQFAQLAAKLGLSGEETSVVFRDQDLVGKFGEPLALPAGLDRFGTLLDSADGNIYLFHGGGYWVYAAATRTLTQEAPKPLHTLSDRLAGVSRIDAAFTDAAGTEWLIGRDAAAGPARSQVFARAPGTHHWVRRDHAWGGVRNNITDPVTRPALGAARIDTAFRDRDGKTYLFSGDQYVRYSGADYSYVDEGYPRAIAASWEGQQGDRPPARLPAGFRAGLDASFQGLDDRTYLFAGDRYACVEDGAADKPIADRWGRVRNVFAGATGIDAACTLGTDLYLFRGDQVIRYADSIENDGVCVREGYPLRIGSAFPSVPAGFERDLTAALVDGDGVIHLFKDGKTVALAPGDGVVRSADERWGILRPALAAGSVDAAFVGLDGKTYLFSGDTYLRYSGSDYTHTDLGYPRDVAGDWSGMRRVTAAFVLDGKTYLFGSAGKLFTLTLDYQVDLAGGRVSPRLRQQFAAYGLPVAEDAPIDGGPGPEWHLTTETQLRITVRREPAPAAGPGDPADPVEYCLTVHNDPANTAKFYVCYSTRTYDQPDTGHPRPLTDTWWNLPADLAHVAAGFADVDAVFCGRDDLTYLFAEDQFITFDNRSRWWSRPQSLSDGWESLPFDRVDAAFAGTDGKTYVFSGERYVRYSGADYTAVDDRYPAPIAGRWGEVVNNIARTGRVDATLVVQVPATESGAAACTYTYLFSGDQYVRYSDHDYTAVQTGYPKCTGTSLAYEPGFGNLRTVPAGGIDAAFADRRNIYLFSGPSWHVISAAPYRRYGDLGLTGTGCAFVEDGAVLVEEADGWHRFSALEGTAIDRAPSVPHTLRGVPADFQAGLDAVLEGADGYTYLFKGQRCFNIELGGEYPLAEEWGRPRNNIYDQDTVDAAFVGRDGRTYLFSGDQFVSYAGESYTDAEIDGDPQPIAAHWGGLTGVTLAYVRDGKTYLFEPPDEDGTMRYLVYSGRDYRQPDAGFPQRADAAFWGIPEDHQDTFAQVDAVLVQGPTTLLLSGEQCLAFDEETGRWSYPRPIGRLWRGFPFGDSFGDLPEGPDGQTAPAGLTTAFTGADGATYFFSRDRFTRYDGRVFSPPRPVRDVWGRARNNFVAAGRRTQVDAAFVDQGTTTFLFSGDQYVRYSGPDYRHVDAGYPKPILGNLRTEGVFAALPDSFEDVVADRIAAGADPVIDAAVGNGRSVYVFLGADCHVASRAVAADYELAQTVGHVRNTLAGRHRVDAALVTGERTFLFSGDQYVRYTGDQYGFVDEGYPRTLATSLPAELGFSVLPEPFSDRIDAAVLGADGVTYLFTADQYLPVDPAVQAAPAPRPVTGTWGKVRNRFTADPADTAVDAAFCSPAGELYVFKDGQYLRYQSPEQEYADEGFPRSVRGNWGDLPAPFEAAVDGACVLDRRAYLFSGQTYVRYSGASYHAVDRMYPQPFGQRWAPWADYLLTDVRTVTGFKQLGDTYPGDAGGLAGFLDSDQAAVPDPYRVLAGLFGWDAGELRWLRRQHGFLPRPSRFEERFEIEFVAAAVDLFAMAGRLGAGPSAVFEQVWSPLYAGDPAAPGPAELDAAADALQALLLAKQSEPDRLVLAGQLHAETNLLRRDALVAAVMGRDDTLRTARDVFERLLIDVEMGSAGLTSRVREALAATQLYYHRYFLGLEPAAAPAGRDEAGVRQELKAWWTFLQNYRVWEANRQVFLYPENYLRPELRTAKTPAFETLENDLMQGEITPQAAQRAYQKYLDEYTEVSRLSLAGGYVYAPPDSLGAARRLVLFGATRTDPLGYYYRFWDYLGDDELSGTWSPWAAVNVQIDADKVYPVFAFGRVFVFWAKIETVTDSAAGAGAAAPSTVLTVQTKGDTQHVSAVPKPSYVVRVYYSFYNLNMEWAPAQALGADTSQISITGLRLRVELSEPADDGHQRLLITCSYTAAGAAVDTQFGLTPELTTDQVPGSAFGNSGVALFDHLFAEPALSGPGSPGIDEADVVVFNSPAGSLDGPWFGFDHKGGSFLCKPAVAPVSAADIAPLPLAGNTDQLPLPAGWDTINAAFQAPDGTSYFFSNATHSYVTVDASGQPSDAQPIASRWGREAGLPAGAGVVDAVLVRGDHVFLFCGSQYLRFTGGSFGSADDGYPRDIVTNTENLPHWTRVGAAFSGLDGTEYFFSGESGEFVASTALDAPERVADRWGKSTAAKAGNLFTAGTVDAAFVDGTHTYLFCGDLYVRYTGDSYQTIDEDYPRGIPENDEDIPRWNRIGAAFMYDGAAYFLDYPADHTAQTYVRVEAGTATQPRPAGELIQERNALAGRGPGEASVTAAYLSGGYVYLVGGSQFVRYTVAGDGTLPEFIDAGYPRPVLLPPGVTVDGVLVRGTHTYVFAGPWYAKIGAGQELDTPLPLAPIRDNWGNLPAAVRGGIGGLFDGAAALYLFQGGSYIRYLAAQGTGADPGPYEFADVAYDIVRLTTSTAYKLNQTLLSSGVPALLSPATQETAELPAFIPADSAAGATPTTIKVRADRVGTRLPVSSHLDFDSANGIYYWEIFFHAPMLIAQSLTAAQKFEDAKGWYEYIFDPTEPDYWRFLPFLVVDAQALAADCQAGLDQLTELGADVTALAGALTPVLAALDTLIPAFQQRRPLEPPAEQQALDTVTSAASDGGPLQSLLTALPQPGTADPAAFAAARDGLAQRFAMLATLQQGYDLLGDYRAQIQTYLDDPFDPHAIAALRPSAYRRSVVMAYIDNLLDWGDMLFRQYTGESIDEARMLYVLAYDLLGPRPDNLGPLPLPATRSYAGLQHDREDYDFVLDIAAGAVTPAAANGTAGHGRPVSALASAAVVHASVASPYFFIPENGSLDDYWARVEDRLQKIRQSLNILGISQPVPLFSPPLDPMALVEAAASGAALDAAAAAAAPAVPQYRFAFLIGKAQDLTQTLIDLGSELLLTLEKRDAEQLNLLQNRQEGVILAMTSAINEAQVRAATEDLAGLQASLVGAQGRVTHYQDLLTAGQTALELAQIGTMIEATVDHAVSTALNIGATIAHVVPNVTIGLFSFGAQEGGENAGGALGAAAQGTESLAAVASGVGEVLGVYASFLRTTQDWQLQLSLAQADVNQITHQVNAATEQLTSAQRQLDVLNQQIVHNNAVTAFMTGKFSSAQLYQWMSGKLAGVYFQAYHLTYEMARAAERALRFERGLRDGGPGNSLNGNTGGSYIQPLYWDSQRNGLLAGESLQADLQRLEQAYRDASIRGLEITKQISLLTLDPVAVLRLKSTGAAEFALTEELFDRDFPGHFRRQICTLSVGFTDASGQPLSVNAMLTQTGHKTVLEADPKAVKYLLDSTGPAPATLRSDWAANQQIALSDTDGQQDSNGLFELNFDDDRYLPFEGTGAVSTWRLEATGRGPANQLDNLQDVVLTLRYTAAPGGDIFAAAVTGMLRPYPAARFFDVASDFAAQWQQFTAAGATADLALTFTPDMFPGMSSRQITGVFATYAVTGSQGISFVLNRDTDWTLPGGKLVSTPGLNLTGAGSTWTFTPTGDRNALTDIGLVLTYTAAAR